MLDGATENKNNVADYFIRNKLSDEKHFPSEQKHSANIFDYVQPR